MLLMAIASMTLADSSIELAPGLTLTPPDSLSLEYTEAGSVNETPVLIGRIEGSPSYFMVADKIAGKQRTSVLWEKLEMEIRDRVDRQSFEVRDRGIFTTIAGAKVWYRSYRYALEGVVHKPVYYLIRQGKNSYWVTLTVAEDIDQKVVKPIADAVLKRAVLPARSSNPG